MRQVIDRITCDDCGRVFEFEALRLGTTPITARTEPLTEWLTRSGWNCQPVIGSRFASIDHCPDCVSRKSTPARASK